MGLFDWLRKGSGHGIEELARRLEVGADELQGVTPAYRKLTIPKRTGGSRRIHAPEPSLKKLQRRILRRVLGRLRAHPCATGFEHGHSIVSNALPHRGQAVVVRMDLKDFFDSTDAKRVQRYFRKIGWNRDASELLVRLCTLDGGLPQGAPTSPRLSNLVNYHLDARLAGLAHGLGGAYSRYADDITFSFPSDDRDAIRAAIRTTKLVAKDLGYRLHQHKKLRICRRNARQLVTGLVVNEGVNLPRATRRRLRAVEHRLRTGRDATLTPEQLAGWRALQTMVAKQSAAG